MRGSRRRQHCAGVVRGVSRGPLTVGRRREEPQLPGQGDQTAVAHQTQRPRHCLLWHRDRRACQHAARLVNSPAPDPNADVDAAPNAGVDAAPNAGVDAAPNAGVDAAPKAEVDVAPNAGVEAAPNSEGAGDAPPNDGAAPKVGVDDVAPNAGVDVAPNNGVDAGVPPPKLKADDCDRRRTGANRVVEGMGDQTPRGALSGDLARAMNDR